MKSFNFYTSLIAALLSISASAQPVSSANSSIYVKIYGAYGLLTPGSYKGNAVLIDEPVKINVVKKGMGGGIRAGIGIGIILNEFINIGIDGEYLMGNKIRLKENVNAVESNALGASGYSLETQRTLGHEVVSIIPNVVFKAISRPTYYVYNRLGVVVGFPFNMTEDYFQHYSYHNDFAGPYTIEDRDILVTYKGKHTLKMAIGYQFSIGVQMVLSEKIRGFMELSAYNLSYDRSKYEDIERLAISVEKNTLEDPKPTVFDHSRFNFQYINSGATGSNIRGVPLNQLTTITYAQDPVIMNAITIGAGLAYRF